MSPDGTISSFSKIPQEVVEHIAFFAATDKFLGPPSGILPLLLLNRTFHHALSVSTNPHLYARIFAEKYDVASAVRRMGVDAISAPAMAEELRRRSITLKRFRLRLDSKTTSSPSKLNEMLWLAYLMVLESDGKNEQQLRQYAQIGRWLKEFWFDPSGASGAMHTIQVIDSWPENSERMSLALWLFWLLLKPEEYTQDDNLFKEATAILKVIALGAHRYPVCSPEWQEYIPRGFKYQPSIVRHFETSLRVTAPAPAAPAILAYLTLVNKLNVSWETTNYTKPIFPPVEVDTNLRSSSEWDGDWMRVLSLSNPKTAISSRPSGSFTPGSLEGVWEGIFTYTEFTSYAALLRGASPSILHRSLVAQHRQTIKLQEWHLLEDEDSLGHTVNPLVPGNPCRGYIPDNLRLREVADTLELFEPGGSETIIYRSWASIKGQNVQGKVRDILLTGQGHSAWGQFSLIGRVRPCDGFVSLSKEYTDGGRGKWLYRAYMVGNAHGSLSGRWRDTLSPAHFQGYEGTWIASRRR